MKKFLYVLMVVLVLVTVSFALIACDDSDVSDTDRNDNIADDDISTDDAMGDDTHDADNEVISAVDGGGKTLVLGEAFVDIYQDEYTVGTPTLTLDEVKQNLLLLEDDVVMVYIEYFDSDENTNVKIEYMFFNLGYYYGGRLTIEGKEIRAGLIYDISGGVTYRANTLELFDDLLNKESTNIDEYWLQNKVWTKYTSYYSMTEAEIIDEISYYVNPNNDYFTDEEFSTEFDDYSIVYTSTEAKWRIKKFTNYNLTFPEAEWYVGDE